MLSVALDLSAGAGHCPASQFLQCAGTSARSVALDLEQYTRRCLMTNEINECCLDGAVRGLNAHQLGGQLWETPNLESQRRMPVDVKTSLWTHLDTWLGRKAEIAHRPAAAPMLESQSLRRRRTDDGAAHAVNAKHRYTDLL